MGKDFDKRNVAKISNELGLVFGWAIVCTEDGEPYFDKQDDHIPEGSMVEAAMDFMLDSRVSKENHDGDQTGTIPFCMPITKEVRELILEKNQTGLLIAVKADADMLAKFKTGELTGFSIGGRRIVDTEVEAPEDE